MRNLILPVVLGGAALAAVTSAFAGGPSAFDTKSSGAISVAVFGDSPYGTSPTDSSQTDATPTFINTINADPDISLVLHVGDIHSGQQYCTEDYDQKIYALWTSFRAPLVYTPGDNEWTDCHKPGEGGGTYNKSTGQIDYVLDPATKLPVDYANGNPVANLELVRSIFFPIPGYTLADRKLVASQSQKDVIPPPASHDKNLQYVENVMWLQSKVLFVTLNIPGGSNNDSDPWYKAPLTQAQSDETANRTTADLDWIDAAFDRAKTYGAVAVVIQTQADMWDPDGKDMTVAPNHIAGYLPFINRIATRTKAFGKPVLLLNGDSHTYRSDNPLVANAPCTIEGALPGVEVTCAATDDAYLQQSYNLTYYGIPGYNVPNFHRVVVHGKSPPMEWLKLTVNPRANAPASANAFGPFSWKRMIQQ